MLACTMSRKMFTFCDNYVYMEIFQNERKSLTHLCTDVLRSEVEGQKPHLLYAAIDIGLPFDVQFSDADTTGVGAGQQNIATVQHLCIWDLTGVHLQCLQRPIHT